MTNRKQINFVRSADRRSQAEPVALNRRLGERRIDDLSWIPLFRDADPVAVHAALADCKLLELPEDYCLLQPGAANHTIYIPLSGIVVAQLDEVAGPDASIEIAPGECVGELSAIDGKPVSARVVTRSAARVLCLPSEVFWDRLMTLPSVARNLRITLSERMRRTNEIALKAQRDQLELLHLRRELSVARQLQSSMLPLQRPIFPDRTDVDVCGFMEPVSSIGGDLFDAFFVNEQHLFVCIGDVSGHGVAAALFMARAIGVMRVLAVSQHDPAMLLGELNQRLCVNNEANIFLTLFCGILNVDTGELVYSNGGHCPPLLRPMNAPTRPIAIPKGPLIGAFTGVRFGTMRMHLNPGDVLFCYTDGVSEAQNRQGVEFSDDRCLALLDDLRGAGCAAIMDRVRDAVAEFSETRILEDDCTMLALSLRTGSQEALSVDRREISG